MTLLSHHRRRVNEDLSGRFQQVALGRRDSRFGGRKAVLIIDVIDAEVMLNMVQYTSEVRPEDVQRHSLTTSGTQPGAGSNQSLPRGKGGQPGRPAQQRQPELGPIDLKIRRDCRMI